MQHDMVRAHLPGHVTRRCASHEVPARTHGHARIPFRRRTRYACPTPRIGRVLRSTGDEYTTGEKDDTEDVGHIAQLAIPALVIVLSGPCLALYLGGGGGGGGGGCGCLACALVHWCRSGSGAVMTCPCGWYRCCVVDTASIATTANPEYRDDRSVLSSFLT